MSPVGDTLGHLGHLVHLFRTAHNVSSAENILSPRLIIKPRKVECEVMFLSTMKDCLFVFFGGMERGM